MKSKLQKALERILEEGIMDFSIRSYSGRFMYGKKCLAIDGDEIDPFLLGVFVGEYFKSEDYDFYNDREMKTRQDSMGLGIVIYWPNVEYEEAEEPADEYEGEEDELRDTDFE
jgi:hypothetical protein